MRVGDFANVGIVRGFVEPFEGRQHQKLRGAGQQDGRE